jgi:hypothetical protein
MEIELHPDNMNREDGFSLSKVWKPLILDLNNGEILIPKNQHHSVGPGKG